MDERNSKVFSGFITYGENKLYFNYTDHLMNNGLRTSNMIMETDAKNFTAGLTGIFYEFIYRNWNAGNVISMPMMGHYVSNKLMPDVDLFGLNLSTSYNIGSVQTYMRGGVQALRYKDDSRTDFYKELYSDAKQNRLFLSGGLTAAYSFQAVNDLLLSFITEAAAEAPEAEQLFIAVKRPMTNPDWSGNPTLSQPIRTGLRTALDYKFLWLELFGNYIFNYVNVVKTMKAIKPAMTYKNVNATIAGVNFTLRYEWIESNMGYLWGENTINKESLAEIAPISVFTLIRFPAINGIVISLNHRYENAQSRINSDLSEFKTSAWNTIGAGVEYSIGALHFDFRTNNILNYNYARCLSYSRSPFSAGMPVFDPGRSFSLTMYYNSVF